MRAVSLFSGAGGLDLGAAAAGVRPVFAVESDPYAADTYGANLPGTVATVNVRLVLYPSELTKPELIIAGPPCQPFSNAGNRKVDDERAPLLLEVVRAAEVLDPSAIIVENVPEVAKGSGRPLWETVHARLRLLGFRTRDVVVGASDHGVAQTRRRVFLVARQHNDPKTPAKQLRDIPSLRDTLALAPELTDHEPRVLDGASISGQIAKRIGPGQRLSNVRAGARNVHSWEIPEVFGEVTPSAIEVLEALLVLRRRRRIRSFGDGDPVNARRISRFLDRPVTADLRHLLHHSYIRRTDIGYALRSTFNGKYRRLSWNEPSPTVTTRFGDPRYILHPDEHRALTVREAALIQGFPGGFTFRGPLFSRYVQIGNAVPPQMATALITANVRSG